MEDGARLLGTLYQLTHLLAAGTHGPSLLRVILHEALTLTGSRAGQIFFLRPDRRSLCPSVSDGEGVIDEREISADDPPWSDAIREATVVRLPASAAVGDGPELNGSMTLALPLLARGHVLGMLVLRDVPAPPVPLPCQAFLDTLANLAVHALRNSTLYDDL
jgi:GAF domain-containing protein